MNLKTPFVGSLWISVVLLSVTGCQNFDMNEHKADSKLAIDRLRAASDYDVAQQQFKAGNLEQALEFVDEAIQLEQGNPQGHRLRARILIEMGNADSAKRALEECLRLNGESAEDRYLLGIFLEGAGQPAAANRAFTKAMDLAPEQQHLVLAVAESLVAIGEVSDAIELMEDPPSGSPQVPAYRQFLGHVAAMSGDHKGAVTHFREASMLSPRDPVLREELSYALIRVGNFEEAEITLRELLRRDSNKGRRDLRHLLAGCLIEGGQLLEARDEILQLTRGPEGNTDEAAWRKLGDVSFALGDDRNLAEAGRRLTKAHPSESQGYLYLALASHLRGQREEARKHVDKAVRLNDDDLTRGVLAIIRAG